MKLLRLELSGFTCFRDVQSIAFEELTLFAITGPTGSGKSTLLDALTYALYGQIARLGSRGLDVLISPGLAQLLVKLELETPQGTFRITRTADRKPNGRVERQTRIEQLSQDAKWQQLPESEKLREADEKLIQLIGLDYEGFTRSVLLPQGAFDEFLRGDISKRRRLLVSLLGLERITQMQKLANSKARDAMHELGSLSARLQEDYAEVTPEKRQALREEIGALEREHNQQQQRQTQVTQELEAVKALKILLDEKHKLAVTLAGLAQQRPQIDAQRQRLSRAKQAAPLIPLVQNVTRLDDRRLKLQRETDTLQQTVDMLSRDHTQARQTFAQAEQQAAARLPEIEAELERLRQSEPLIRQLKARGGSLELARDADEAVVYSESAWEGLQQLEPKLPELDALEHNAGKLLKEMSSLRQEGTRLGQEQERLAEQLAAVTEQGKELRLHHEAAEQALKAAQLADQAAAIRVHLHAGDTCPVCLQQVTSLPETSAPEVATLQAQTESLAEQLQQLIEKHRELKRQSDRTEDRLKEKQGRLDQLETEQNSIQVRLQELRQSCLKTLMDLGLGTSIDPLTAQTFGTVLKDFRSRLLASLAAQIAEQVGELVPEQAIPALHAEKQELEAALKTAREVVQRGEVNLERERTTLTQRQKQLTEVTEDLSVEQAALESARAQAGFDSVAALQQAHLESRQQEQVELMITTFDAEYERANDQDVKLDKGIAGRTLDRARYDALLQEHQALAAALTATVTTLGARRRDLETLEVNLDRLQGLRERQQVLETIYETYKQLGQDLRGDQFQDFLLSQVQRDLARHASHIMQAITDGRYALNLRDNDYLVQDFWHGGEERDVRTLSGGETFIASLALALALSETIAGSQSLGALFLDEGFGTLDGVTLDSVATVLENLSETGRMVGVITHVQALTDRLPTRLTVTKGTDGSRVSWDLAE
jgi:exonuclease SbcC